jgi:hypothetical protein
VAEYQELRIRFERTGEAEGDYRVFVSGPAGEAAGTFRLPYSDVEVENLVLKLSRPRSGVRRIDSSDLDLVRGFGGGLFDAVFSGRVRDVYRSSLASARNEGCGMRISLALTGTPELMHVPWEYLYDDPAFLSISMWTPVVRYLDLASSRRPLKVEPPLRILAMVSSPSDIAQLDVAQERTKLEESLAGLVSQGAVEIHWLPDATLQALQRELRHNDFHVFHYIGHGGYDRASDDGVLALEDGIGRSRLVSGMELGTILADEMTLRLAVLNACEGARSSVDDPFSGVATSLVRREIPAVVAMQLEITDRAAITFAGELYAALADGYAVDAALAEARKAIFADENEVEWATPVLFMRVPDGRIFDVEAPANVHEPVPEPEVALIAVEQQAPEPVPAVVPLPAEDDPVVPEPESAGVVAARGIAPVKVPGRLVAALAASTVALAVAVVYPWDNFHDTGRSWVNPYFGQNGTVSGPKAGFFTALSPVAVVLLAAIASIMVARARRLPLAVGLLVACGLAASAKYLGVVGRVVETRAFRLDSTVVFCLAIAASLALIFVGIKVAQLAGVGLGRAMGGGTRVESLLLLLAGLLVLVACLVAYNGVQHYSVVSHEGSQALDPLAGGLALLAVSFCFSYLPRLLGAGILIALGLESATLWARYIGIPAQLASIDGSVGAGGLIGLAGAALAVVVGIRVLVARPAPAVDAVPSLLTP